MENPQERTGTGGKEAERAFGEAAELAQQRLEQGMKALSDWGAQARELMQRQPAVMLAGAAVLGFVTGLLLRRAASREGVE